MKYFSWDNEKNMQITRERNISFEQALFNMEQGRLPDILQHPDQEKYPDQKIIVIAIHDGACLAPFVETESEVILKTIIPSRRVNGNRSRTLIRKSSAIRNTSGLPLRKTPGLTSAYPPKT
jgi:hypothetical protein